jgi:hypothetical protein
MESIREQKVADCRRLAREARERADRAGDFAVKRDYLNLERRWLLLAQSYEWSNRFAASPPGQDTRIAVFMPPDPPDPSLPRVMCSECGKRMRLASIEPMVAGRAETHTFECDCGNTFAQTALRR